MSLAPYCFRPATPPEIASIELQKHTHSRNTSTSTFYTNDTSPESVLSHITTPSRSPILRQNGPTLLPKIRAQDNEQTSSAGPKRNTHRRVLSTARNPPGFAPYTTTRPPMQRSVTEPVECLPSTLISPITGTKFFWSF